MTDTRDSYAPSSGVRTLANGVGFSEGPVITGAGGIYVTSIDHGRVYEVGDGQATVFAEVGGGANGATMGRDGKIYVAQNGGRWARLGPKWGPDSVGGIQVVDPDRTVAWLTKDPIAPNDLCFGPDGYLYFTDPTRSPVIEDGRIWRVDIDSGEAELLLSVSWFPNGIGFDAEDALYVASSHDGRIVRFALAGDHLADAETVVQMRTGRPDGFAFDTEGNLLVPTNPPVEGDDSGEVQIWSSSGHLLDTFRPGLGHRPFTNVALSTRNLLVITDSGGGGVIGVEGWPTAGLPLHPFRT